jgi:hypothetical protein
LFINLTTQVRLRTSIHTRKGTLGALWKMLRMGRRNAVRRSWRRPRNKQRQTERNKLGIFGRVLMDKIQRKAILIFY